MTLIKQIYNSPTILNSSYYKEFILDHPYPSFNTIQSKLSFRLDLVYNKIIHVYCEKIYMNINDTKNINILLNEIFIKGNIFNVIACLDIIKFYSPLCNYDVNEKFELILHNFISRG